MAKKLVMCGCHQGGVRTIKLLLNSGFRFDYFVCLSPEQGKKHKVSGYYDYSLLAKEHGIKVYYPEFYSLKSDSDQAFFNKNKFDLIIQGGWQRLFPEGILNSLGIGALGLHGSSDLLPKGRGRSPLNWSLIEGKKRFIMHLFLIKSGVDDGDVIDYCSFDILEFDDIKTLYYKYDLSYSKLILENIDRIFLKTFDTIPQLGNPSYYSKREEKDGEILWEEMDVWQIYNFVRAQTKPYPGAFAQIDEETYRIWKAQPFDTQFKFPKIPYGSCIERFDDNLIINCLGGLLLVTEYESVV